MPKKPALGDTDPPMPPRKADNMRVTCSVSAAAAVSSSEKTNTPSADQAQPTKDGTTKDTPAQASSLDLQTGLEHGKPWSKHPLREIAAFIHAFSYGRRLDDEVETFLSDLQKFAEKADEEERKEKEALTQSPELKLVRRAVKAENLKFYDVLSEQIDCLETIVNRVHSTVSNSQIQIMDTAKSSKAIAGKLTELNLSDRISPSDPHPPNGQLGSTIPFPPFKTPVIPFPPPFSWDDAAFRPETFLASAKEDFSGRQLELNNKMVEGLKGPLTFQHQCQFLSWSQEVAKGVTPAHFQLAVDLVIATLDRGYYPNHNETLLSTPEWAKLACATVAAAGRGYARSHAEEKTNFTYAARLGCEDVAPRDFDLTFDSLFHRLGATAEALQTYVEGDDQIASWLPVVEDEAREVLEMVAL
ncbi:hypothetical protein BC826DRAFT_1162729 [Russula brevipes]|nr:hypothetical protein BC826DRAFT_1162729 [Russula brevipes]